MTEAIMSVHDSTNKSCARRKPNFTHDELVAINNEIGLLFGKILEIQATITALRSYDVDIPITSIDYLNQVKQLLQKSRNNIIKRIKDKS